MTPVIVLITAIVFYFIGRFSINSTELYELSKKAKKLLNKKGGMVIDYPTPEEQLYRGSEQEKIDKQQEKLIKEAGII